MFSTMCRALIVAASTLTIGVSGSAVALAATPSSEVTSPTTSEKVVTEAPILKEINLAEEGVRVN